MLLVVYVFVSRLAVVDSSRSTLVLAKPGVPVNLCLRRCGWFVLKVGEFLSLKTNQAAERPRVLLTVFVALGLDNGVPPLPGFMMC